MTAKEIFQKAINENEWLKNETTPEQRAFIHSLMIDAWYEGAMHAIDDLAKIQDKKILDVINVPQPETV